MKKIYILKFAIFSVVISAAFVTITNGYNNEKNGRKYKKIYVKIRPKTSGHLFWIILYNTNWFVCVLGSNFGWACHLFRVKSDIVHMKLWCFHAVPVWQEESSPSI